MGKALDFINKEREHYGRLLYNINNAICNIAPFIDRSDLKDRKYVSRVEALKRYMELLEDVEAREKKEGFLGFLNDERHIGELQSFKRKNQEALNQLEMCNRCVHMNCPVSCRVSHCLSCRQGSWVAYCDHDRINVTFHENFNLDLTNERTGRQERYKVHATLYDVIRDKQYIVIEGISSRDKFVLYYYPGIIEDTYGEIRDEEEFDFVVSTFESVER